MPDREVAARQPVTLETPGNDDTVRHVPGEIFPEALALARRAQVCRCGNQRVMYIDMLRGIVGVGDRSQQELAEPALPFMALVHQLMADNEHHLGRHAESEYHQHGLPHGQVAAGKNLPEHKRENHRPQHGPHPDGQVVYVQLAVTGAPRIHVAFFQA